MIYNCHNKHWTLYIYIYIYIYNNTNIGYIQLVR